MNLSILNKIMISEKKIKEKLNIAETKNAGQIKTDYLYNYMYMYW